MKIEITDEMLDTFRAAWNAADAEGKTGDRVRAGLEAVLTDVEVADVKMWVNAFGCVRPTEEFKAGVGAEVITQLMTNGQEKVEPLDPYRSIVIRVACS